MSIHRMGLRALGAVFAVAGICLWSSALAYFQPEAASPYHEMTSLALLAKDLRWSALLLGIGGLVLLTRGARLRTQLIAVPLLVWAAADVVLDRIDARGTAVGIGTALTVAAGLAAATVRARRDPLPEDRHDELAIVYSGASLGVAVMMVPASRALRFEAAPPGPIAAALALGPLLVLAAVAVALSAPPRVSRRRAVAALGTAVLVGVGFELAGSVGSALGFGWAVAALSWAVAVPVLACALLSDPESALRKYYVALAPAFAVLAPVLCFGIFFASALGQFFVYALTGDRGFVDAGSAALSGLVLGVVLSAFTLAPRLVRT